MFSGQTDGNGHDLYCTTVVGKPSKQHLKMFPCFIELTKSFGPVKHRGRFCWGMVALRNLLV